MTRPGPFRVARVGDDANGVGLDRGQKLQFRFDGREFEGFAGDTLASALLANGMRAIGRSFKFHRPRGVYTCGFEEPNALVQLESGPRAIPSTRATLVELYQGLQASSYSGWPGLKFDIGRALDFTAPLWAAGFYNKTFIWPRWHTYEGVIRRMAGFGHAPTDADPDRYETSNLHCDVLVIGGGESGLKAARKAADEGSRVVIVEQAPELGGRCAWSGEDVDGMSGSAWVSTMIARLEKHDDVRILRRSTAVGYYERDVVTVVQSAPHHLLRPGLPRERYWIVRAKRIVVAAGAIEQPLIFCNNDRPGILLAGAAREYLRRYGVAPGRQVVVATNNDSAYATALDLKEAGVHVCAIVDTRHQISAAHIEEMRAAGIALHTGWIPVNTSGFGALTSVTIGKLSADAQHIVKEQRLQCDALAVSGGWNPSLHLYTHGGGKLVYQNASRALGAASHHAVVEVLSSPMACGDCGIRLSPVGKTQRQWVDLRHDVTVSDIELALRENYSSIEHVKRYTTVGMSADQGKTSNLAAIELVARLRGVKAAQIGHTTMRPPFMPVTLGAIAGRAVGERFAPIRRLPMHDWHVAHGGVMEDYGEWKRPSFYARSAESRHEAMYREARAVRNGAGILDFSPLGKLEVHGPDALDFLDRFYINDLKTLKPGRARYGLMLRESGVIFDDGTVVMLAPDRFLVTTTSANIARVTAWLEEWHQCEWPQLRVAFTPVTEQWATVSLAGPRARDVLSKLDTDIDLSNAAFPHLGMREGRLFGLPTRIYRVSFTGELSYEINVPARSGQRLWDALLEAGKPFGLQAFGLDALLLMRMEKGFLHVGTDTDGTTVPDDVGWGKVAANKATHYIGKRSLSLPENVRPDRLQLIGLKSDTDIVVGSHLRVADTTEGESSSDGWVTSAGRTVLKGEPVALALLRGGRARIGSQVAVHDAGRITQAKVVNPPFFDATGERMNG